jgi:hypothetical protein
MRLGKEQAAGYVEDNETDSLPAQEPAIGGAEGVPPTAVPEPPLTVS